MKAYLIQSETKHTRKVVMHDTCEFVTSIVRLVTLHVNPRTISCQEGYIRSPLCALRLNLIRDNSLLWNDNSSRSTRARPNTYTLVIETDEGFDDFS